MTLTSEQQQVLSSFPEALRQLVLDELACGNSIVDIGHSFPAPPAGAYIKLANTVSTRPRESDTVLSFRARNSAISSGEFTDDVRFYFVIEPPSPPELELDMDAVRRERELQQAAADARAREDRAKENALVARAQQADARARANLAMQNASVARAQHVERVDNENSAAHPGATTFGSAIKSTHSPTGAEYRLNFQDSRPPHEIQFALERKICVLFTRAVEGEQLCMRAKARVNGASYALTLTFAAAKWLTNSYVLHVACSWAEHKRDNDDYFRGTSRSWFEFWTKDFRAADASLEGEGSAERYRTLTEVAMQAEAHLDSVAALKQTVVDGLKRGGTYSQSHKEGGTEIAWRDGAFVRSDYGDNPAFEKYSDEASFLAALRQFCNWDIVHNAATESVSDVDAWRLLWRRMRAS